MQLRNYQQLEMVDPVRQAFRQKAKRVLLTAPTGAGKTACFSYMALAAQQRGNSVWIMVHRDLLVRQASRSLTAWGCPHGILSAGGEYDGQGVQVVSIQTLSARLKKGWKPTPPGFLISDECFVAGTMVSGRPIESLRAGDNVDSFNHDTGLVEKKRVLRLFRSKPSRLCRVLFSDGSSLDTTPSHPIYDAATGDYVEAKDLTNGSVVLSIMPYVMPRLRSGNKCANEIPSCKMQQGGEVLLLKDLCRSIPVEAEFGNNGQDQPEIRIRANEGEKSHEAARRSGEGYHKPSLDAVEAANSRRKWQGPDRPSAAYRLDARMGNGGRCLHRDEEGFWISKLLQGGRWESGTQNSNRSEWRWPSGTQGSGVRQEEEGFFGIKRVERVVFYEPSNYGKLSGMRWDGYVYNIEVEKNHNYFANNILVHNCHHAASASWLSVFDHFATVPTLGVTATPCRLDGKGLGGVFDRLVLGPTTARLIEDGFLCRPQYWGVPQTQMPDLEGVGVDMGDFNKAALAKAVEDKPRLTGDVVAHYKRRASGLKFVGFACNIKHATALRDAFNQAGVRCEVIHGALSDVERDGLVGRLDRGEISGLWSVDLVSEGFDLPEVSCVILCRPTKSLSLHLQQLGRGLRIFPGKTVAIILDHAGNLMRDGLGAAETPQEWSLDGVRKVKRDAETLPAVCQCPECFRTFLRAPACPACGYVFPVTERKIKTVGGTLKELSASEIEAHQQRVRRLTDQGQARDVESLAALHTGTDARKALRWAQHILDARNAKEARKAIDKQLLASGRKIT